MNRQSVHYNSLKIMNVLAILKDFTFRCKSMRGAKAAQKMMKDHEREPPLGKKP